MLTFTELQERGYDDHIISYCEEWNEPDDWMAETNSMASVGHIVIITSIVQIRYSEGNVTKSYGPWHRAIVVATYDSDNIAGKALDVVVFNSDDGKIGYSTSHDVIANGA